MGREQQKRKNRSSISKVRPKKHGRTKTGKKKVDFLGNETIARNWDRKSTLAQNYERLGLSAKLNSRSGGTEKKTRSSNNEDKDGIADPFLVKATNHPGKLVPAEVQVERNPVTGRILRVVGREEDETSRRLRNPLDDPLNDIMDYERGSQLQGGKSIISELEAEVAAQADELERKKKPRHRSAGEAEWLSRLVEKHGEDTQAMARDSKLNPMQQTAADIGRRIKIWKASIERG